MSETQTLKGNPGPYEPVVLDLFELWSGMQTPSGSECPYYFEDYHRGRERQECRLIDRHPKGGRWTPDLCGRCHVPRIVMANACKDLVLEARVERSMMGLKRSVGVSAYCMRTNATVDEPEIGCGRCHEALNLNFDLPELS